MVTVNAIQCPECKEVIFSRARHDFHHCSCGFCSIDGGFDYVSVGAKEIARVKSLTVDIPIENEKVLFNDWNSFNHQYGTIKEEDLKKYKYEFYKPKVPETKKSKTEETTEQQYYKIIEKYAKTVFKNKKSFRTEDIVIYLETELKKWKSKARKLAKDNKTLMELTLVEGTKEV